MLMENLQLIQMLLIVQFFWVADCRFVELVDKLVRYILLRNLFERLHLLVLALLKTQVLVRLFSFIDGIQLKRMHVFKLCVVVGWDQVWLLDIKVKFCGYPFQVVAIW